MVHVSVRDTDTDSCSVRSDVSVKSVNLYGSPIPENLDSWREGFIIIRVPGTRTRPYQPCSGINVLDFNCPNALRKLSLNVIS